MQVDPMKPVLKAPGIKLLKLRYYKLLSSFPFHFSLHRYNEEAYLDSVISQALVYEARYFITGPFDGTYKVTSELAAGAYPRYHFRSTSAYFAPFRST